MCSTRKFGVVLDLKRARQLIKGAMTRPPKEEPSRNPLCAGLVYVFAVSDETGSREKRNTLSFNVGTELSIDIPMRIVLAYMVLPVTSVCRH